jgi:hypothetical protein
MSSETRALVYILRHAERERDEISVENLLSHSTRALYFAYVQPTSELGLKFLGAVHREALSHWK